MAGRDRMGRKLLNNRQFNVAIVGAGNAGIAAAAAASRRGAETVLISASLDAVAHLGHGPFYQLRELGRRHGLGGILRQALERSVIDHVVTDGQRALILDGSIYQGYWKQALEREEKLSLFQDVVDEITKNGRGWSLETAWGLSLRADTLIIAVGAFMGVRTVLGNGKGVSARPREEGDKGLEGPLAEFGANLLRTRVEISPTVHARSIDWARVHGSGENRGRAARVGGGAGVLLLPTSKDGNEIYLLRAGKELRAHAEHQFWRAIPALRNLEAIRGGRAIEHLVVEESGAADQEPVAIGDTLYFAGRVAGAAGYEDAMAQGARAGRRAADVSRETWQ